MHEDIFKSERDFNNRYPSKMFRCSNCGGLTTDKYECSTCGWRADGLLKTMGKGYKYKIISTNITEEIFPPIELERINNDNFTNN